MPGSTSGMKRFHSYEMIAGFRGEDGLNRCLVSWGKTSPDENCGGVNLEYTTG